MCTAARNSSSPKRRTRRGQVGSVLYSANVGKVETSAAWEKEGGAQWGRTRICSERVDERTRAARAGGDGRSSHRRSAAPLLKSGFESHLLGARREPPPSWRVKLPLRVEEERGARDSRAKGGEKEGREEERVLGSGLRLGVELGEEDGHLAVGVVDKRGEVVAQRRRHRVQVDQIHHRLPMCTRARAHPRVRTRIHTRDSMLLRAGQY
eukprot:6204047-Pleurochrysis_carterae.AAC.1